MSAKRSFLNYLFLFGIGLFHVYVIFHKQIHMTVNANAHQSGVDSAGCPLRMAKSFFSATFLSSGSFFVSRPLGAGRRSPIKTNLNIVDVNKGQNVLSYVRNIHEISRMPLFATAEPMSGGTSCVAPKLTMSMSVPVPTPATSSLPFTDDFAERRVRKKTATEALEIAVLGLSHHTASVDVREQLSIPESLWNDASSSLCDYDSIHEAAVLSTCNRFEIYVAGKNPYECMRDAIDYLHKRSCGKLDISTLRQNLFLLTGEDAAWHLMRVSAGLDSLVVGEGQILSQVKKAHEHGINQQDKGQAGKVVSRMLNTAVTAGKRVRTETGISRGAVSVSSAAAEFTATKLKQDCGVDRIEDARITILGAGKMARLLLVHLQTQGVTEVTVLSRSLSTIQRLQDEFPELKIKAGQMDALYGTIAASDVVFPCTSSVTPIVEPEPLAAALRTRDAAGCVGAAAHGHKGLMFVDISVPRNVHADCSQVAGAACYNVDHLKAVVKRNTSKRRKEMQDAEVILKEELGKFRHWQQSLGAIPTITRLQEKAEALRQEEMLKAAKKLSSLSEKDLDTVEKVTKGIVAKLIHGPMSHLRQQQEGDATRAAILQVQQAFQLEEH